MYVPNQSPYLSLRLYPGAAAGGLYVDNELRKYLEDAFASPAYHPETIRDYIQDGVKDFEQHGKREFNPNKREILVHVAGRDVNDDALNIQHGDMVIPGYVQFTLLVPVSYSRATHETPKPADTYKRSLIPLSTGWWNAWLLSWKLKVSR